MRTRSNTHAIHTHQQYYMFVMCSSTPHAGTPAATLNYLLCMCTCMYVCLSPGHAGLTLYALRVCSHAVCVCVPYSFHTYAFVSHNPKNCSLINHDDTRKNAQSRGSCGLNAFYLKTLAIQSWRCVVKIVRRAAFVFHKCVEYFNRAVDDSMLNREVIHV